MRFERVLVVTAHPDDPEFLAGGTIATLVRDASEVTDVKARGVTDAEGFDPIALSG